MVAGRRLDMAKSSHIGGRSYPRTGCLDIIGGDAVFPTRARAIEAIHQKAHEGVDERPCPLIEVVEIREPEAG
jgi:hypothetical protein